MHDICTRAQIGALFQQPVKPRGIGNATCRVYEWNKQNLSYTQSGTSLPCQKLRFRE
jgi:hypothetical protein